MKKVSVTAKRKIIDELMEGVEAMKRHRKGKITLRTFKLEPKSPPRACSRLVKEKCNKSGGRVTQRARR